MFKNSGSFRKRCTLASFLYPTKMCSIIFCLFQMFIEFIYLGFDIKFLYTFSYILAFAFCCNFVK